MIIVGLDYAILSDDTDGEQNVISLTKAELDLAYLHRACVAPAAIEGLMGVDAVTIRRLERSLRNKLSKIDEDHREQVITMLLERDVQLASRLEGANDVLPARQPAIHGIWSAVEQ